MIKQGFMTLMVAAVFALATGCGRQSGTSTVGDAATEAQKAFAAASAELKTSVAKAVQAYSSNDFVGTVVILQAVQSAPSLTPEQTKALDNLTGAVYEKLAEAIEKGDPKAIQARQQLRNLRR